MYNSLFYKYNERKIYKYLIFFAEKPKPKNVIKT